MPARFHACGLENKNENKRPGPFNGNVKQCSTRAGKGTNCFFCDNNFCLIVIADCVLWVWYCRYSSSLYETWTETVGESSQYNLSLPLISRDPATRLISVNFNPQVFTWRPHARKSVPGQAARCVAACNLYLWTGFEWFISLVIYINYLPVSVIHLPAAA